MGIVIREQSPIRRWVRSGVFCNHPYGMCSLVILAQAGGSFGCQQPPTAHGRAQPALARPGDLVTLVGIAADPNEGSLYGQWSQVDGPTVTLTHGGGVDDLTFIAPELGDQETLTLVFEFRVRDEAGNEDWNLVVVTVEACQPPADFSGVWRSQYSCTNSCGLAFNGDFLLTIVQTGSTAMYDDEGEVFTGRVCGNVWEFERVTVSETERGTLTLNEDGTATRRSDWDASETPPIGPSHVCRGTCTDTFTRP